MNYLLTLGLLLLQDDSTREDYFLGAALVAMIMIAIIFLFIWSRRRN